MITPKAVNDLFNGKHGTRFAAFDFNCPVKLAAAHKDRRILKQGTAGAQLFANIKDYNAVYENAVKRDLEAQGNTEGASRFQKQTNWFVHHPGDVYSVVRHRKSVSMAYLYAIMMGSKDIRYVDFDTGVVLSKAEVISMMTPSQAKALQSDGTTYNATYDITHSVVCRTFALANIVSIRAEKQAIS